MEINSKEDLINIIKELQSSNSELVERVDTLSTPKNTEEEDKDKDKEKDKEDKEERTEKEIDEIEKLIME